MHHNPRRKQPESPELWGDCVGPCILAAELPLPMAAPLHRGRMGACPTLLNWGPSSSFVMLLDEVLTQCPEACGRGSGCGCCLKMEKMGVSGVMRKSLGSLRANCVVPA